MNSPVRAVLDQIERLRLCFVHELQDASSLAEMEILQSRYFGKKGHIQSLMSVLKDCSVDEKPYVGRLINDLKGEISSRCEVEIIRLKREEMEKMFSQEGIDPTLPGRRLSIGRVHPLNQILQKALDIFVEMGFSVQYGPDVDEDFYNFEALNFSADHPARDMQDTFYLGNGLLLRTHTSNVQIHAMEKFSLPLRIAAPGRAFRNEDVSVRSHVFFHQVEGFYIDEGVSFSELLSTINLFLNKLFGFEVETRFRPSYFPFVEPGMEVDVRCTACQGNGCSICKQTGWLEILGAGMIHPNVLKKSQIDAEVYSGYAWGIGIDRIAMLRFGIPDIRLFTENDMRFLTQFP